MSDPKEPTAPSEIAAIEADIERTRADLAHTVDELGARVEHQKQQAGKALVVVAGAAGAVVLAVVVVKLIRRNR
jgi:hypothetical protein